VPPVQGTLEYRRFIGYFAQLPATVTGLPKRCADGDKKASERCPRVDVDEMIWMAAACVGAELKNDREGT